MRHFLSSALETLATGRNRPTKALIRPAAGCAVRASLLPLPGIAGSHPSRRQAVPHGQAAMKRLAHEARAPTGYRPIANADMGERHHALATMVVDR